ncbi:hypothetical protein J6590_009742 [Homalodisca vitripennis]|nr:hypothetical protein J6590_009742 [Homalodisca vitripennis]
MMLLVPECQRRTVNSVEAQNVYCNKNKDSGVTVPWLSLGTKYLFTDKRRVWEYDREQESSSRSHRASPMRNRMPRV